MKIRNLRIRCWVETLNNFLAPSPEHNPELYTKRLCEAWGPISVLLMWSLLVDLRRRDAFQASIVWTFNAYIAAWTTLYVLRETGWMDAGELSLALMCVWHAGRAATVFPFACFVHERVHRALGEGDEEDMGQDWLGRAWLLLEVVLTVVTWPFDVELVGRGD